MLGNSRSFSDVLRLRDSMSHNNTPALERPKTMLSAAAMGGARTGGEESGWRRLPPTLAALDASVRRAWMQVSNHNHKICGVVASWCSSS